MNDDYAAPALAENNNDEFEVAAVIAIGSDRVRD